MSQERKVSIGTHAHNGDTLTFKSSNTWTEHRKKKGRYPNLTALHNHLTLFLFLRQDCAPELSMALLVLFAGKIEVHCQSFICYCSVWWMSQSRSRNKNLVTHIDLWYARNSDEGSTIKIKSWVETQSNHLFLWFLRGVGKLWNFSIKSPSHLLDISLQVNAYIS